jgi:hypothetical protein
MKKILNVRKHTTFRFIGVALVITTSQKYPRRATNDFGSADFRT